MFSKKFKKIITYGILFLIVLFTIYYLYIQVYDNKEAFVLGDILKNKIANNTSNTEANCSPICNVNNNLKNRSNSYHTCNIARTESECNLSYMSGTGILCGWKNGVDDPLHPGACKINTDQQGGVCEACF